MNLDIETRQNLKQDLLYRSTTLGQQALLPAEKSELNMLVQQLETLNPTPLPLAPENRSLLLGDWKLLYASNGTVVTRRLTGGIIIHAIWQTLSAAGEAVISATRNSEGIAATNGAELGLPLLGRVHSRCTRTMAMAGRNSDCHRCLRYFFAASNQAIPPTKLATSGFAHSGIRKAETRSSLANFIP